MKETLKALIPSSLIGALFFYYGFEYVLNLYWTFGVTTDMLGFTSTDYILRSIKFIFPFGLGLLLVWLVAYIIFRLVLYYSAKRNLTVPRRIFILTGIAILLGGSIYFGYALFTASKYLEVYSACMLSVFFVMAGIFVWWLARYDISIEGWLQRRGLGEKTIVNIYLAVLVVMVFGVSGFTAKEFGYRQAMLLDAQHGGFPSVTVYSTRNLSFPDSHVSEIVNTNHSVGYPYQYSGLKMLIRSDKRYFLFPEGSSPSCGLFVLPENDATYVKVAPP